MSSMATSPLVTLFFTVFFVLQSTTNAFNISEILNRYTQFKEYNSFLTMIGVANDINNQKAVTVLVISNDKSYSFKHVPGDVLKNLLTFQVILGYYDESKLKSLKSGTSLATLNQQSTLTVDHDSSGSVTFNGVKLLSTIETQPPSISVLQIETTLKEKRDDGSSAPPPSSTPPQKSPSVTPTKSPPRKALAPPPTSLNKTPPTPNASPNKPSNAPPQAPSSSTKGNNNAPLPSKTKPSSATPSQTTSQSNSTGPSPRKSLGPTSSDHESPIASPPKPSSTSPVDNPVQAPGPDMKSYARARKSRGNYLASILMIFGALWFLFSMS